jgi:Ca2+-binding RTX toxin-like protein
VPRIRVVFGGDFGRIVTCLGDVSNNTLSATHGAERDVLVGDLGDDVLVSDGGSDILLGGGGNDRLIVFDSEFTRINGGGGFDTLAVAENNALHLESIAPGRIQSVETIDLRGAGANTLYVTLQLAKTLPRGTLTLTIQGDENDKVVLDSGSASAGSTSGFVTYKTGEFVLRVSKGVTIDPP